MNKRLNFDSLWYGCDAATMVNGQYSVIEDAAIGVHDGRIAWIGPQAELPACDAQQQHDFHGGWVTPGLVDCHTHLVFGGNRAHEFEQRLNGMSYQAIAQRGGGIAASVQATRQETPDQLLASAARRLKSLMCDGVTTLEIKSGYGLSTEHEAKMLEVAHRLAEQYPVDIRTTCLAAHAVPPEYQGHTDAYIDYLCDELLPEIAQRELADAVDAFCETIAFSPAQVERYFRTAQSFGMPVKLHAEQLSSLGGATLAARFQALSADHLEFMTETDVAAMRESGTVAVLLPGAYFTLKETQRPPVDLLRRYQVPMAVATDINPGTSPVLSLRLMMNMACTLFGLTPEETLAATTIHAAQALGLAESHGQLSVGKVADFVCWDVASPGELSYWLGGDLLKTRVKRGVISHVDAN
ncbi:imidazolonepropionase [Vibrio gazogenes]|uniref:Imidazolonepropionase n=1 Tax=Vibrio gazogenes DSM 21264 = NBRC 103151 TaxID=1123492 RepID=A0A1M5FXI4_VIBGA|nr:imidazolonepropionase [Vibrio gazogenes]USP14686.1 imidazolonepropionase [Vibrio gazogenes]SHF96186.1 imidazolonepropionase [Vibrio gazogenes DSM 21264] [Vibrio gazogenes DSM 21264 = NBRC 103151]SJN52954.1 Imidazolonepropionase [Vibrio gazogenes]